MTEPTDKEDEGSTQAVFDYVPSTAFQTGDGEYIVFPEGMKKFADTYRAEAIGIDADWDIQVLRIGPKKDQLKWVSIIVDNEET